MRTPLALLLVAVLGPVLAFGVAWGLARLIRRSTTRRGARQLALAVVVGLQLFVIGFSLYEQGLGWSTAVTVLVGGFLTWQASSMLQRSEAPTGEERAPESSPPPSA